MPVGLVAANYHWLIYKEGLWGAASSDLLMYPVQVNWLAKLGFPVDAIFSYPFTLLFGWPAGYTLFILASLWLMGLSMAWLAGRWWRSASAALIAGVVLQCSCLISWEVNGGRAAQIFGVISGGPAARASRSFAASSSSGSNGHSSQ